MSWFSRKDWNVIAVILLRTDLYQISGQRGKGEQPTRLGMEPKLIPEQSTGQFSIRGRIRRRGAGPAGQRELPAETLKKLERDLPTNKTVLDVLRSLETKESDKVAKPMAWNGYPKKS